MEDLNDEIRAKEKKVFGQTVYRDMPILQFASSLPKGEPPAYRQMRRIGAYYDRGMHTESRIFYEQAKYMEDFSDDYPDDVSFRSYYPTYRIMSLPQQRTYFTWRTRLRAGEIRQTDISYVFVYIYELLNLVGASSPEDAFSKLRDFYQAYRVTEPTMDRYMPEWLQDFVVYYGLPKTILDGMIDNTFDENVAVLLQPEAVEDDVLFDAMQALATFHVENSRFYREYPTDFRAVSTAVYRKMCAFYADNRKSTYCESLFGKLRTQPYAIFSSAVFYDQRRFENRSYEFGPFRRYVCADGRWLRSQPPGGGEKSKALGAFLRNIDSFMREACNYPFETKASECTKQFSLLAKKEIASFLERKNEARRRVVTIDFSALDRIRAASEATKEKILTAEERGEELEAPYAEQAPQSPASSQADPALTAAVFPNEEASSGAGNMTPLSALHDPAIMFLRLLSEEKDPTEFCRARGMMPSVLADEINEALFDYFADTVIDFSADVPEILPDYADELKDMLSNQA